MVRSIDQPGSSPEPGSRDGAGLCRKGGGRSINSCCCLNPAGREISYNSKRVFANLLIALTAAGRWFSNTVFGSKLGCTFVFLLYNYKIIMQT